LDCSNRFGLVEPLFIPQQSAGTLKPVSNPLPTIAAAGAISIIEPFIFATGQTSAGARSTSISDPISTVVTKAEHCIVEPFMVKFYGNERGAESLDDLIDTISTKDHFGLVRGYLVEINGERYLLDIRFRMLQPHELAKGMGFPENYRFKQIGNAVCPNLSEALIYSALSA